MRPPIGFSAVCGNSEAKGIDLIRRHIQRGGEIDPLYAFAEGRCGKRAIIAKRLQISWEKRIQIEVIDSERRRRILRYMGENRVERYIFCTFLNPPANHKQVTVGILEHQMHLHWELMPLTKCSAGA